VKPPISQLKRLPKGAFELAITVPQDIVKNTYEEVVNDAVKNAEIPGFRKGTAPRDRVEPGLDKKNIYEEIVKRLIPKFYVDAISEHKLRPILNPRVQLISAEENKDWTFTATSCEAPEVTLGDYKSEVKKTLASDNLWVPGKGDPTKKEGVDKDEKLNKIIDHLLNTIPIEPSDLLVEEETNHSLARLVDQTQSLGITVEQYLASTGKTAETLRAEYATAAKRNLQVEFLLNAIVKDLNVQTSQKEIDDLIASAPDEKSRENLNTPSQRASIAAIFARRRALDSLLSLA
jgi:FKBP-type peptidyl-prolyl cis-trans isomerase (trigger factor)